MKMIRKSVLSAAALLPLAAFAKTDAVRPNVVLILADDLGYGDLGCYGATKIKTPNIDRLANEGMRFTDAYATSQVCCPSRYGLLTGVYPWRAHHRDNVGIWSTHQTPLLYSLYGPKLDRTLPALLRQGGYATGAVGKWHQGLMNEEKDWNKPLQPGPLEAGFDWFFGDASNRYRFYIENHHVARTREDNTPIEGFDDKSLKIPDSVWKIDMAGNAAVLNDKAVEFLRKRAGKVPFFLYYCPNNVHTPLTPGAAFKGSSGLGEYGDFVQELDWTVGEVIRALEETGELANTLIVFTSDNGGKPEPKSRGMGHRTNAELLGQKTDVWEGGVRVPFIVRWPGFVPAGKVSEQLVTQVDLLPTLTDLAGIALPEDQIGDGRVLSGVLKGDKPSAELAGRVIAANVGNRSEHFTVRKGDWVYINKPGSGGVSAGDNSSLAAHRRMYYSVEELGFENSDLNLDGTIKPDAPAEQLYNLAEDPGQKINVIGQHPEKAGEMRTALEQINLRIVMK
jgi:arylsulfatase A